MSWELVREFNAAHELGYLQNWARREFGPNWMVMSSLGEASIAVKLAADRSLQYRSCRRDVDDDRALPTVPAAQLSFQRVQAGFLYPFRRWEIDQIKWWLARWMLHCQRLPASPTPEVPPTRVEARVLTDNFVAACIETRRGSWA